MPTRYHNRGTFVLRRRFRGVGEVRVASGTKDPQMFQKLDRMLLALYDQGRIDLLKALRGRLLHPMEVWDRFRVRKLDQLPGPDVLPLLVPRWNRWMEVSETSDGNLGSRKRALELLKAHLEPEANLTTLPAALLALRTSYSDRPRSFNLTRAASMAFVRDVLGKRHSLYDAVSNVPILSAPTKVHHRPLRPAELVVLVDKLPEDVRRMVWTMAVTGAGPKEYLEDGLDLLDDRVHIHGAKRRGAGGLGRRDRIVPRLPNVVQPSRSRSRLRIAFKEHAPDHSLYDLRRTFANLLVEAGIPRNRRQHYLGHAPQSMDALYERPEITTWLREDAAALTGLFPTEQPGTAVPGVPAPLTALLAWAQSTIAAMGAGRELALRWS